ncbi:phosphatidylglycerophosphatase A [bacterium BMS3Abin05]|nr:phosphatidylglycerophosphatase A [bacterium BMS3Abin05]GBE28525.1 phosphatidylglycerophosphatase A [bacterium BMS3Bbin03]HDK36214.1 phosphatidylglycerophosphatase A [Bacteroidota bacterium]HDZ10964.1 phosphatidylglycerophosphatase A [Bacteroidota bacterium]
MKIFLARFLSTTAFTGLFPIAPGTVGSLVTIVILWFLPALSTAWLLGISVVLFFTGIWSAGVTEKAMGVEDPGSVNLDEDLGMVVSIIALPKTLIWWGVAFLIFRFLDILKPWPAKQSQAVGGGLGIMIDDVIVAIYTNLLLQAVRFIF